MFGTAFKLLHRSMGRKLNPFMLLLLVCVIAITLTMVTSAAFANTLNGDATPPAAIGSQGIGEATLQATGQNTDDMLKLKKKTSGAAFAATSFEGDTAPMAVAKDQSLGDKKITQATGQNINDALALKTANEPFLAATYVDSKEPTATAKKDGDIAPTTSTTNKDGPSVAIATAKKINDVMHPAAGSRSLEQAHAVIF